MKLADAQFVAQSLVEFMRPACERIEIAGSIRRECAEVKDIEIVCIPAYGERPKPGSLFERETTNLLYEQLAQWNGIQWIKPGESNVIAWKIQPTGKYWRGLVMLPEVGDEAVKLDLFLCRPENWGVIYTIRTGSADFSRALVTYARDSTPYRVQGGELTRERITVPCSEEQHLFDSLNLEWIDPRARGGERDLQVKHG